MRFCNGCGQQLASESLKYCQNCGAPVSPLMSPTAQAGIAPMGRRRSRRLLWAALAAVVLAGAAVGIWLGVRAATGEQALFSALGDEGRGYGFINSRGEWVIPPSYPCFEAPAFSEGLAAVQLEDGGPFGFIDEGGRLVIPPSFDYWPGDFSDGLSVVMMDDEPDQLLSGYIDKTGRVVIPVEYYGADDFSEGLAAVAEDESSAWGYIDKTGRMVIRPQFQVATAFSEGFAAVQPTGGELWGFIDKTGSWVVQPRFYWASAFSEGLALAQDEDGLYGYVDSSGTWAIRPQFDYAADFHEGLAVARMSGEESLGYIDDTGRWVIMPQFYDAYSFSGDLAAVVSDEQGLFGYIDKTGRYAIRPQFVEVSWFLDGLAYFQTEDGEWGYIDQGGRVVWQYGEDSGWGWGDEDETVTTVVDETEETSVSSVDVTWETSSSPCFIREIFSEGGEDYIVVDYIQLEVPDDATEYDPWIVNDSRKLRTFVVPDDAWIGSHYLLLSLGHKTQSQVENDSRFASTSGIPITLDVLQEALDEGLANLSGDQESDWDRWWDYKRWWQIEVKGGRVVSLVEASPLTP